MNIWGSCKECPIWFPLAPNEIYDGLYECPSCGYPHDLGDFMGLQDRPKEPKIFKDLFVNEAGMMRGN